MLDVSGGAGVVVVVVAAEVKGVPKANATTPAKREAMVTVVVEWQEELTLMDFRYYSGPFDFALKTSRGHDNNASISD